jgi:hypothetical protein
MCIIIIRFILGYSVSMFVGTLVLWCVIDKCLWPRISKNHGIEEKKPSLTMFLGILERALYTTAFILKLPAWIGIYLAMKVAVGWRTSQTRKGPSDNLYLIGNLLSILFGLIGAFIALWTFDIK